MENIISTSLCQAARLGLRSELRRLIDAGHHVFNADNRGYTPLHEAVQAGHEDCAELLLQEEDCNPNAQTHEGYTPLYIVCKYRNESSLIDLLANYGADCNIGDKEEVTPLHIACGENKMELVRALLNHEVDIDVGDFDGLRPLHAAVSNHHLNIMRELLERGASVDDGDMYYRSPLYVAAQEGWKEGIQLLIEHGASVNFRTIDGHTPLMAACQRSCEDIVYLLMQHGADPNIESGTSLALSLAVHSGSARLVELLLKETRRDVILRNCSRASDALVSLPCLAIDSGSLECLTMILDADLGPSVNNAPIAGTDFNKEILEYSCMSPLGFLLKEHLLQPEAEEMMDLLLENGVPVNVHDLSTMPPVVGLMRFECDFGVSADQISQIKLHFLRKLLKSGCDIDYCSTLVCYPVPDALVAASLLQKNNAVLRIMCESTLACNANQLLKCLRELDDELPSRVVQVLKEYMVPSVSRSRKIKAFRYVPSLQVLSRFAVRRWLWKKLHSSSKVKGVLNALRVPLPVQRYLIGCAWIDT